MNCVEFERVLPEFLEGGHSPEQQAHLNSCSLCSSLVADLNLISSQAKLLVTSEDPSPAVWDAIEAQLRSEGLIRGPELLRPQLVPSRPSLLSRWRSAWMVPVAAVLVIMAGIKLYHPAGAGDNSPIAKQTVVREPQKAEASVSAEDQQVLRSVAPRIPAQRTLYSADLDSANSFIRDAEQSMRDDPNDIYTQQMLINAYAQKQMLYDLAVNRTGEQ